MANKSNALIKKAEAMAKDNAVTNDSTKDPKKMRGAFIRVTYENQTKDGIVTYDIHDIQKMLEDWSRDKRMKYALICHGTHCHVVIKFNDATDFDLVKKKFPYGRIEVPGSKKFKESHKTENIDASYRGCVRYLPHADQPEKRLNDPKEYTIDDIITNDRKWVESFFVTEQKTVEDLIRENICVNSYIQNGEDLITRNIITDKQYLKYKRFIELRLSLFYKNEILPRIKNRNINVIMVISPKGGTGKTAFIKAYFEMQNHTAYIASDRDPMQQYNGEDVLILDDARDTTFKYNEMLKLIDEYTGSPVGSRNVNKLFLGHTIVIITNQLIGEWYKDVISVAKNIGYEDGTAFYRRLQQVWTFGDERLSVYDYVPTEKAQTASDYFELRYTDDNPITDDWKKVNVPCEKVELLDPRIAIKLEQLATIEKNKIAEKYEYFELESNKEVKKAFAKIDEKKREYASMLLDAQKQGYLGYNAYSNFIWA